MTTRASWRAKLLLALVASVVCAELGVRIYEAATGKSFAVDLAASLDLSDILFQPHPYIGFDLRPGAKSPPNQPQFSVNSLGFRGAEFDDLPAPRTLRIACLGGSTVWGTGCSGDDATWPAVLERALSQALPDDGPYDRVEVINAGVSGFTIMESFIHFKMRVLPHEPTVVIVYHGINDARVIGRNTFRPDYTHVRHPWQVPTPRGSDILFGWSHFYGLLRGGKQALPDLFDLVYVENFEGAPIQENIEAGVQNYRRTLNELIAIARVNGCEPILSTFTYTQQLPLKKDWMVWYGFRGVDRINQATVELADFQNALVVDIHGDLGDDPSLFVDPVHLSDEGNRRIARAFGRQIVDAGLLSRPLDVRPVRLPD